MYLSGGFTNRENPPKTIHFTNREWVWTLFFFPTNQFWDKNAELSELL